MKFRFTTFNHCLAGRRALDDMAQIVGLQLAALGHDVEWSEDANFIRDGFNIVFESFADSRHPALPAIASARNAGCRFLYIATEKPGREAFNDAPDQGMKDRQRVFPEAARFAEGILHFVDGVDVMAWYGRFRPAAFLELGHAPALMRLDGNAEPTHDFGFFGKSTPRRVAMLDKLRKYGSLVAVHDFIPRARRDAMMRQAKVIVQIREYDTTRLCSSSRCATALSLGRPVVAEPHDASDAWRRTVTFSDTEEGFYDCAAANVTNWRGLYERQLRSFETILSPECCVEQPLQQIGVFG